MKHHILVLLAILLPFCEKRWYIRRTNSASHAQSAMHGRTNSPTCKQTVKQTTRIAVTVNHENKTNEAAQQISSSSVRQINNHSKRSCTTEPRPK